MSSQFEFTYISTFAGCGGSSLGYKWAGGKGLLTIEFDANAAATYRANFATPVLERDICTVTAEEVLKLTGLKVGELDVLDGSPPCQGFSTAGKRQIHDPRNSLFREFVRLIEGLQPKVFVMENVSGMVKGKMKYVFAEIMRCLKATGYTVRCQLLNAMYFNVPQSRERLVWIGVRKDVAARGLGPQFPKAQGRPVTAGEAMAGLARCGPAPAFREWNRKLWHGQKPGQKGNGKDGCFNHVKLHPDRPSPTVPKSCVFGGFSGLYHWAECRALSIGELAALTSFPAAYKWPEDYEQAHNRIGNCVPPRFMQAIAECIRDTVLRPARD
jgi:DNA (cytosine-5)-methyltransferase 1